MLQRTVCLLLVLGVLATNDVGLVNSQTNLTVGDNVTALPVNSVSYSGDAFLLMAASGQSLFLFTDSGAPGYLFNARVNLTETVREARFRNDALIIAAIGTSTNNLYLLANTSTGYTLSQTILLPSQPTSITWSTDFRRLLVGMGSGSVAVFALNGTAQYAQTQLISTSHASVSKVSSVLTRFATCGGDTTVNIFYYNTTTAQYILNQTVTGVGTGSCTSLDFSPLENRIASGRSDGTVVILQRDQNYVYSVNKVWSAHSTSVNFAKWSSDSVYLLTGAANDPAIKLWTAANNFSSSTTTSFNGQSADYDSIANEYTVGSFGNVNGSLLVGLLTATNCVNGTVAGAPTTCNCNSGQIWQNGNCSALSCTGLLDSPGTALNATACNCNSGFIYNSALMACQRNCQAAVTANSNGSNYEYNACACVSNYQWDYPLASCYLMCWNIAGSSGNANATACNCLSTFTWNAAAAGCAKNCTGAPNSNGTNATLTTCYCNTGFSWNTTVAACSVNCSGLSNSNNTNNGADLCYCNTGYTYNAASNTCTNAINCIGAVNSPGTNFNSTQCNCNSGFFWNTTLVACAVNCSTLSNSNNTNNGTNFCFCNSGYSYNVTSNSCTSIVNCIGAPNSPGTNFNSTQCNCNSGFSWNTTLVACSINCSALINSNNTNNGTNLCFCNTGFAYNSASNTCRINCVDPNSMGTNLNDTWCNCNSGFFWNTTLVLCAVNCSGLNNSNNTNNGATLCHCNTGYIYDVTSKTCISVINCTADPNSNGTNATLASCYCKSGFAWNTTLVACAINCSTLSNSNNTNNGAGLCFCNTGYNYNLASNVCKLNCTKVSNSPGTNFNNTWCNCNAGFLYRPTVLNMTSGVCQIDCTKFPRTSSVVPISPNYDICTCANGYNWGGFGTGCVLQCSTMTYSTGKLKNATTCKCRSNYIWDKVPGQCIASGNSNTGAAVGCGVGIPLGLLGLVLAIAAGWYYCKKKKAQAAQTVTVPVSTEPPVMPTSTVLMPQSQMNYNNPRGSAVNIDASGAVMQPAFNRYDSYKTGEVAPSEIRMPVASKPVPYSNDTISGSQARGMPSYQAPQEFRNDARASQALDADPYRGNPYQFSGGPRESQAGGSGTNIGPRLN